jgi:hypothetical protein
MIRSRLVLDTAATGLAVPPGELFDERVIRGRTVLLQALRGRYTPPRHEPALIVSVS